MLQTLTNTLEQKNWIRGQCVTNYNLIVEYLVPSFLLFWHEIIVDIYNRRFYFLHEMKKVNN